MREGHNIAKKRRLIIAEYDIVKKYINFFKKLTRQEKRCLALYKGSGYMSINKYLLDGEIKELYYNELISKRKMANILSTDYSTMANSIIIKPEMMQKYIENWIGKNIIEPINTIDNLFTNKYIAKLNGDDILYRGLSKCFISSSKIGDEILLTNYSSTSGDWGTAENFAYGKQSCICVLKGLKDVPYIYLPWSVMSSQSDDVLDILKSDIRNTEFEILLPRNLKFKITGIDYNLVPEYKITTYKELSHLLKSKKKNINSKSTRKQLNRPQSHGRKLSDKIFKKIPIYELEFVEMVPKKLINNWELPTGFSLKIEPSINPPNISKNL